MSIERGSPEAKRLQLLSPASGAGVPSVEPPDGPAVLFPSTVIQPDGERIMFKDGKPIDEAEWARQFFRKPPQTHACYTHPNCRCDLGAERDITGVPIP